MPQPNFSPAFEAWLQALPDHEREYEIALLQGELNPAPTVDPSQAYSQGGNIAREAYAGVHGERPQALTPSQETELMALEQREGRLRNIPMYAPGSLGTDMRHNRFGIDTRSLNTGMANFALSLINRERNRRLAGDPRKLEQAQQKGGRAGELLQILAGRPQTAAIHSGPVDAAMASEAGRLASEAERLGREGLGVRGRAGQLRGQQQARQEYDQGMIEWLEKVAPGLGERIMKHDMDADLIRRREDRDVRGDRRDHDYRMERLEREYELRGKLEGARNTLRSNPGSSAARGAVWSEVYTLAKTQVPEYTTLPGQIQNAQQMLRHHVNNRPIGNPGSTLYDQWERSRKELERDIEKLTEDYAKASRDVHRELRRMRFDDLVPVVEDMEQQVLDGPGFEEPSIDRGRGIPGLPSGAPQPIDTGIEWQ